MNMQTVLAAPVEELPWTRIVSEVNAWRGACIQAFAQGEAAVTETLLFLNDFGERGKTVRLRHLIGQRLEDLALALGPEGSFGSEGGAAFDALAAFRTHETLRANLAHDVARIAIERNGTWVVVFRHLSIRGGSAERGAVAFEQPRAAEVLTDLRRRTQQLDAAVVNLRQTIERVTRRERDGEASRLSTSIAGTPRI